MKAAYIRSMAAGLMGLAAVICINGIPARAAETGTVTSMSEKVYQAMDVGSNVVGNVIMNGRFYLLSEETDGQGNRWYLIETDLGMQGYIPAANVITGEIHAESGGTDSQQADTDAAADGGSSEEMPGDAPGTGSASAQIRTVETVNVRSSASTDADIAGKIPKDTILDYSNRQENELGEVWYEVEYGEIQGYIREGGIVMAAATSGEGAADADAEADGGEGGFGFPQIEQSEETAVSEPAFETENNGLPESAGEDVPPEGTGENRDGEEKENGNGPSQNRRAEENDSDAGTEDRALSGKFYIDWVLTVVLCGCLVCLAVICLMGRKIKMIYGSSRIESGRGRVIHKKRKKKKRGDRGNV